MPKTYCTYRIKVANRERVQVEKWNSLHQPLGDPSGAFRYVEKLDELTPLLASALNNELNDSSRVRTLGETLFDILFDDVLRQDFVSFYEQVVHRDKQLLRIELVIDEQGMPEVAALPWEFMCVPERANLGTIWLSTAPEVVFSRRRSQYFAAQPIQLQKNEKLRIALVVASPPGLPVVAYEPIQEALEKLAQEKAELVELLPVLHSASLESIDEMLSQKPHIVHFMGHCGLQDEQGKEIGVIALVDPDENEVLWVEAGDFSELLNQYRPGLVMLQASQSGRLSASQAFVGVASRVVQQNIPVVVAMQYDVSDTIASRFARRFYKQLAEGDPVDIAAQYGRRAISLSPVQYKKRDFATPVIFMRVEDGYLFQTYKEEPPAPSSSVEMRRRLEAAMPQTSQVDRPTEIRVMVALHDSPGLRATLPDVTESGDLIQKNDAVQNDVALEFPVDSKTQEPLPINIFVAINAPGFKVEQPAKSIRVSPKYDSGIITFFLTPTVPQKYGRVVVEWFGDEQKNTLLGSLTLITETLVSQNQSVEAPWKIEKTIFDLGNSKYSDISITQEISSLEGGTSIGIKTPAEASGALWIDGNEFARGEAGTAEFNLLSPTVDEINPNNNSPDNFLDGFTRLSGLTVPGSRYFFKVSSTPDFDNKILSTVESGFEAQNLLKFCPEYCNKVTTFETATISNSDALAAALKFVLLREGGYVNDPADPGGATNMGVFPSTYDTYRIEKRLPTQPVEFITNEEVHDIYFSMYWKPSQAELAVKPLAVVLFDTAVNFGVGGAIEFLQEALGIGADGIFGPTTRSTFLANNNRTTAEKMVAGRIAHRNQRVTANPSLDIFLQGWLNRDNDLKDYIAGLS